MDVQTESPKAQAWQRRALHALQRAVSPVKAFLRGLVARVKGAAGRAVPWAQQNTQVLGVALAIALLLASLVFVWQYCSSCRYVPARSPTDSTAAATMAQDASIVLERRIDGLEASLAQLQAVRATPSGSHRSSVAARQPATLPTSADPITAPTWGTTDLDRAISEFPLSTLEQNQ